MSPRVALCWLPSLVSGKILFAMYGVTSRAGGCNKGRLLEMVDNLRQQDVVDVYTFANAVSVIDSVSVSSLEDSNFLASFSDTYERERQHIVDEHVAAYCRLHACSYAKGGMHRHKGNKTIYWNPYTPAMTKNAVRQLYEEWRVSRYLARSNAKYDAVVAVTADIFPFYNISKGDVDAVKANEALVYGTRNTDANGFTNGFFLGSHSAMQKLLGRWDLGETLFPNAGDFEFQVRETFEKYGFRRVLFTGMPQEKCASFVKIRRSRQHNCVFGMKPRDEATLRRAGCLVSRRAKPP